MYKLLTATTAKSLEKKVLKLMENGYVPKGSHKITVINTIEKTVEIENRIS